MNRVSRRLHVAAAVVSQRWRRSLQLRVVATTLLVSVTVVLVVGLLLLNQVGEGLLRAKVRTSVAEAGRGIVQAQSLLRSDPQIEPVTVVEQLEPRGSTAGLYDVAMLSTSPRGPAGGLSARVKESDIPERLRRAVSRSGAPASTFTTITRDGRQVEALVVGAPVVTVSSRGFQLYYLFPLTQEEDTLALVRGTVAFAGSALVLLLALIAGLVTRQVVRPVRGAARTAERLSAGHLEERMKVRGEDDLAQLAAAFNQMAESLQQQIRELEELSRVQRDFVSDVSHELRTPLTTVRLAADVLYDERETFPPEIARAAELLVTELDRFEALLVDLLEISRFDANAAVLDTETVDVAALVRQCCSGAESVAARRGITLDLSGVPEQPVTADVDPRRVARILRNLVVNAIDHGEGRPVSVTVAGDDTAVAVTVRDLGIGLRPGEASLVFHRFWRADPSRARHTGGTGLGLAIALEDARLHGGWLQAWGAPGRGAVFRLTLPRHAQEHISASPLPLEPAEEVTGVR